MKWILAFMAMLPVIDVFERWFYSRDVDYIEGERLPRRWLCWGTCRAVGGKGHDFRYVLIRLPSWDWCPDYSFVSFRSSDVPLVLMQRAFLRFAGRWMSTYVESMA